MGVSVGVLVNTLCVLGGTLIVYILALGIWRAYFDPLSKIPGPKFWAASRLPMFLSLSSGRLPFTISELHQKYGPVVRLAPTEVSFIAAEAWEIYQRSGGRRQMQKDPLQFKNPYSTAPAGLLFEADDRVHGRLRRNFSNAFSEKSMREQEPIVKKYIDLFIAKLHEKARDGVPQDIAKWYNFVAFDHIGDLVFGESFHCLETDNLHAWITMLFDWAAGLALTGYMMRFGILFHVLRYLVPKNLRDADHLHRELTRARLNKRLDETQPRSDFLDHVIKSLDTPTGISYDELLETCRVLVTGGSETTATLLSGVTYYLCSNPSKLLTLTNEIRSSFDSPEDINMSTVSKLDYLLATLNEGLRLFPPVPGNMRRFTPPGGATIAGIWVPGNTMVAVDQYAAYHSPTHFAQPQSFIPERWLSPCPSVFSTDNLKVVQPFGVGPRNCIGKTLAYMEMRLILARLLFEFDLKLTEDMKGPVVRGGSPLLGGRMGEKGDWLERCDIFGFWKKPPLMVKLMPVSRGV